MTDKARTIFLGTGAFAVPVVAALARHPEVDLIAVVTAPRREGARGRLTDPPVAVWAADNGIPTFRPARLRADSAVAHIVDYRPDLLVLADYGQIVPAALLEAPVHGALNLHPSLLPKYRGASPIPAAILAGEADTGVTLMRMDAGLDTGPIVSLERVTIESNDTAPRLEERLAETAAGLLTRDLEAWLAGDISVTPQARVGMSLTRPLRREDGRISPSKSATQLERQVRAYQPWPGSFLEVGGVRLVVWHAEVLDMPPERKVGDLYRTQEGLLALQTADGVLAVDELQPAGGRRMSSAELLRGRPGIIGATITETGPTGGTG